MNHQQFEEWIFNDEPLLPDQELALEEHLHSCEDCRRLYTAWRSAEDWLQSPATITPAAGFTARWEARAEAEQARRRRRINGLWSVLILLAGIGLVLASLGVFAWSNGGPANAIVEAAESVTQFWTFLSASIRVSSVIVEQFPVASFMLIWALMGAALILAFIWLASFYQVTRIPLAGK
ncbi:MAG: zf-HC2 domain-containing protein [Anaerolineales bacterium]|nr:zf-HC2 domain-containing protein [Anaerolineales bacterium]